MLRLLSYSVKTASYKLNVRTMPSMLDSTNADGERSINRVRKLFQALSNLKHDVDSEILRNKDDG